MGASYVSPRFIRLLIGRKRVLHSAGLKELALHYIIIVKNIKGVDNDLQIFRKNERLLEM